MKYLSLSLFFCFIASFAKAQTTIYVYPGTNQISDAIQFQAFPGDIIELAGGEYIETQSLSVPINLTIRGADGATVRWFVPGNSETAVQVNANLNLENIIFDTDSALYCIRNIYGNVTDGEENSVVGNSIFVNHCQFLNFYRAILIPDSRETGIAHPVDSLFVTNCLFYGNYNLQPYPNCIQVWHRQGRMISIQNCTFWHYPVGSEAMHIDGFGFAYDDPRKQTDPCGIPEYMKFIVDHCTFYDVNKVGIFVEYANEYDSLTNNVFEDIGDFAIKGQWCNTFDSYIDYNIAHPDIGFNCEVCQPWHYNLTNIGAHCATVDPKFIDPENGDFRYQDGSPAIGAADDGADLGNPVQVWYPGTWNHEPVIIEDNLMSITSKFKLEQNFPNPFNPTTTINFSLSKSEYVTLDIYNITGQKIQTVITKFMQAGSHTVIWNGLDDEGNMAATGIYYYRLRSGNDVEKKKMTLIK